MKLRPSLSGKYDETRIRNQECSGLSADFVVEDTATYVRNTLF